MYSQSNYVIIELSPKLLELESLLNRDSYNAIYEHYGGVVKVMVVKILT